MTSNKHILFISYDGMTDPLGQSQVIPYLTKLCKYGYRFTILSCEKPERFSQNKNDIYNLLAPFPITWVSIPYHKKPPVLSTLWDIFLLKKTAKKIHQQQPVDMVHTRPGIPALVGLWMKKKWGIPFLHDIREFYADSRVDGGMWNINTLIFKKVYQYFKTKEAEEIAKSDGIVCLTYAAEKVIVALPAYKKNTPLTVIPCSVDLDLFNPSNITATTIAALKEELGIIPGDCVVSYLGSIGGWYLTKEMMQFCKQLLDKIPSAKFLFISPHLHKVIAKEAAQFGIPAEKLIVKHANRLQVPALLFLSNYSLFFIKPCFSKLSSSPTKHGEIMAMGIPVITNSGVGDVADIVSQYDGGFVVNDFSATSFSRVINEITSKPLFDKSTIRKGAADFYSLDIAVGKYNKLYRSVLYKEEGI